MELSVWKIIGFLSTIALLITFKRQNSVWGGFTIGGVIGIIAGFIREGNYDWYYVAKFAIVGTIFGLSAELMTWVSIKTKR